MDWQQKINEANQAPHKFWRLADDYMNATGRSVYREKFDSSLFKAILEGIQNFEQIWRVIEVLYGGGSGVTRKSIFNPHLFRRALELAGNDSSALKAIADNYDCPPKISKRAEKKLHKLEPDLLEKAWGHLE